MPVELENVAIEKEIGQRIGILRSQRGETQEELAAAMGVSREIIQHWESATRKIKATQIAKIARHFNTTADYILGVRDYGTYDKSISNVCETTGLSQRAAELLTEYAPDEKDALSAVIESGALQSLLLSLQALRALVKEADAIIDKADITALEDAVEQVVKLKAAKYQLIESAQEIAEEFAPRNDIVIKKLGSVALALYVSGEEAE